MKSKRDQGADDQLRRQIRQLILLRETGPKSAAWHAARAQLIWRLQAELKGRDLGDQEDPPQGVAGDPAEPPR